MSEGNTDAAPDPVAVEPPVVARAVAPAPQPRCGVYGRILTEFDARLPTGRYADRRPGEVGR